MRRGWLLLVALWGAGVAAQVPPLPVPADSTASASTASASTASDSTASDSTASDSTAAPVEEAAKKKTAGRDTSATDAAASALGFVYADRATTPMRVAEAPDTVRVDTTHSPRSALRRSLLLPGWGQVYNGQAYKAPIVAGTLGGLATLAVVFNSRYLDYRRAYRYIAFEQTTPFDQPDPTNPNPDQLPAWQAVGRPSASTARFYRDQARRNRDLTFLVTGLVYTLQALDAYVAAHLRNFDISENLSFQPTATSEGPMVALRWTF